MAQELDLAMEPGSGELLIRDAEEPYFLESPTVISGQIDDTTGVITGLDLATPDVSFEVRVAALSTPVQVTASFSSVTAGSGTGQLSPDGSLHLETSVRVGLHIEAREAGIVADCVASPVRLVLDSTEPYDEATGVVPVADADFVVPPVAETATCSDIVVDQVNPTLAGAGHALELTLAGAMTIPTAGETPSMTTLVADPAEPVSLGQAVELTATVASDDPEVSDVPTGNVRFLAGGKVIGQAPVEGGVAVVSVSTLRLGTHQVTAEYRGDDVYKPSTSAPVAVIVQADPVVEVELPPYMVIGAAPVELDVTVDNPSVGRQVSNARVDITIKRFSSTGASVDSLAPDDVLLEVRGAGNVWSPVTFTQVPAQPTPTIAGTLGPQAGRLLAAGATLTDRVRLSFPNGSPQTTLGPLDVVFDVVEVAPGTGDVVRDLSSTAGRLTLMLPGLIPSTIILDDAFAEIRPMPVRQFGTIGTRVYVGPVQGFSIFPSGTISVAIDGQPVPFFATDPGDLTKPNPMTAPILISRGNNAVQVPLPAWVGPGAHRVTFSYSGSAQYAPSSLTRDITVIEAAPGLTYTCELPVLFENRRFTVQVSASGRLSSVVRPGASVPVGEFSLDVVGSLDSLTYSGFDLVKRGTDKEITVDFGAHGSGSATDFTISPEEFPLFDTTTDVAVALPDEQATLTPTGAPGEVIVPKIEKVVFSSTSLLGAPQVITCVPVGDPIALSPVTIAGTTLAVDGPAVVRADDEVTLTASTFPATATGTVRFSSGEDIIDIVPVTDGRAVSVSQLPEGTHAITARFFAGVSAPSTTSEAVVVKVLPATECASFAEEGSGAVVRLVYLELLRRCPDQAGFDYWVGRLDGGTSAERFARTIAATPEAVGVVVDDAYLTMLGRPADGPGKGFWVERLRSGAGRYDRLLAQLGASPEFWAQAGSTNAGFVTRVYEQLLHRSPDQGGLDFWVGRLDAGMPRGTMIVQLANLDEPLGRLVVASYDEILGRAPGTSERGNGITFLRSTGDRSGLYAELIGRPEFATRAGTFPNPED